MNSVDTDFACTLTSNDKMNSELSSEQGVYVADENNANCIYFPMHVWTRFVDFFPIAESCLMNCENIEFNQVLDEYHYLSVKVQDTYLFICLYFADQLMTTVAISSIEWAAFKNSVYQINDNVLCET